MKEEDKICKNCKYYVISSVNPMKGTCTVMRKALPETQKTSTYIKGKLVNWNNSCDKFEPSKGWEDAVEHTI